MEHLLNWKNQNKTVVESELKVLIYFSKLRTGLFTSRKPGSVKQAKPRRWTVMMP